MFSVLFHTLRGTMPILPVSQQFKHVQSFQVLTMVKNSTEFIFDRYIHTRGKYHITEAALTETQQVTSNNFLQVQFANLYTK